MIYSKGINAGKILSLYFQKKTYDFINTSIYKHESSADAIQNKSRNLQRKLNKLKKLTLFQQKKLIHFQENLIRLKNLKLGIFQKCDQQFKMQK